MLGASDDQVGREREAGGSWKNDECKEGKNLGLSSLVSTCATTRDFGGSCDLGLKGKAPPCPASVLVVSHMRHDSQLRAFCDAGKWL